MRNLMKKKRTALFLATIPFLIGFNSGKILFYKVLPESVYTQFDYMSDLRYHSSKITGIALNNMTNNFYTCGYYGKF